MEEMVGGDEREETGRDGRKDRDDWKVIRTER